MRKIRLPSHKNKINLQLYIFALFKPSSHSGMRYKYALISGSNTQRGMEMRLERLNCFGVIQGEHSGMKMLSTVQVHCVILPWLDLEDKRFIIVLHKLGYKFTMIYWLNMWTWLHQRSRLESCMAGFRLEAEMSDSLVWVCICAFVSEFVCVSVLRSAAYSISTV